MAGLGLVLAVFLTTQLPEARRVQTKFNNRKKEILEKKQQAERRDKETPQR